MEEINIFSIIKQWRDAEDCWLSPQGKIYKCIKLEHSTKAAELLKEIYGETVELDGACDSLHQKGWARYSTFGSISWAYSRYPTQAQIDEMYFYSSHSPD